MALRTFRRRVKLSGQTDAGTPIFALGSVMLTYPSGGRHFYPVARCSRCGNVIELPEPVLSSADLELSRQPHLCQTCARGDRRVGPARPRRNATPSPSPSPAPSPEPAPDPGADLGRAETDAATVISAAVSRAEEIQVEAERAAAALRAQAEARAAEMRAAAEADAARWREASDQAQHQARAILAQAESQAAEILGEAAAELDAAVAMRVEESGPDARALGTADDGGGDGLEA